VERWTCDPCVHSLREDDTPVPKHVGYLKWSLRIVILCVRSLPEDGTPLPKHGGYLKRIVGLVIPCVRSLPEDGTPVPKHVGVCTYHELRFMIPNLLYFY
jgi:hypothetical protein